MHILLTDVLTCPRCGPRFGLILLADEMAGREVVEGGLGCSNCRESYRVRGGVADLRRDPAGPALPSPAAARGPEWVERLAALLGVTQGPGSILLVGASDHDVDALASHLPFVDVVAAGSGPGEGSVVFDGALPFRDRAFRGAALASGATDPGLLRDAARLLAPGARLVADPAPPGTAEALAGVGLRTLLDQEGVVVASAP